MKIIDESLSSLNKRGIYSITSDSGKRYIGSTKKSFLSRMNTHFGKLKCKHHPNEHLQLAWSKYGSESFTFEILEIIEDKEITEARETYWIAFYKSADRKYGYNINPYPDIAPSMGEESKDKIRETLKRRYKSGEIPLNEGNFKKGIQVWNKGKKYESTDHLKVPKTKTDKFMNKYKLDSERRRREMSPVEVYKDGNLIGVWNNAIELSEYSMTIENNIPVNSRFKTAMRRGKPRNYLAKNHIQNACNTNTPYKGLTFKYHIPGPR